MFTKLLGVFGLTAGLFLLLSGNPAALFRSDLSCKKNQQCNFGTGQLSCPTTGCDIGGHNCDQKTATGGGMDWKFCSCNPIGPPQSAGPCYALLKKVNGTPTYSCACSAKDSEECTSNEECKEEPEVTWKKCICQPKPEQPH